MPHKHLEAELSDTDLDIVQRLMREEDIQVTGDNEKAGSFMPASRRNKTAKIVVSDTRSPERLVAQVANAVAQRDNRDAAGIISDIKRKRQELED